MNRFLFAVSATAILAMAIMVGGCGEDGDTTLTHQSVHTFYHIYEDYTIRILKQLSTSKWNSKKQEWDVDGKCKVQYYRINSAGKFEEITYDE